MSSSVIAVHGGAWAIPDTLVDDSCAGVAEAASHGYEVLEGTGGNALDAVEAAVRTLERNPAFDAGFGAVLNEAGEVELDAVIMDGKHLRSGAVAALGPTLHPVSVARLVMDSSDHALLVGPGATAFAVEKGISMVPAEELVTAAARAEWLEMAKFPNSVNRLFNDPAQTGHDTVGAVAMDRHGNFAAATSAAASRSSALAVSVIPNRRRRLLADNTLGRFRRRATGVHPAVHPRQPHLTRAQRRQREPRGASPRQRHRGRLSRRDVGASRGMRRRDLPQPNGELGISFTTERMAWAMRSTRSGGVRCDIDRAAARGAGAGADGLVELVDVGHPRTRVRPRLVSQGEGRASEWDGSVDRPKGHGQGEVPLSGRGAWCGEPVGCIWCNEVTICTIYSTVVELTHCVYGYGSRYSYSFSRLGVPLPLHLHLLACPTRHANTEQPWEQLDTTAERVR